MSFAYIGSFVRTVYEEEEWWKRNGPTVDNNFTFVSRLDEAISITDKALPDRKDKQLFPRDGDIMAFIGRVEQKEREERKSDKSPYLKQSKLIKLQAVLGSAYAKAQLQNLAKLSEGKQDHDRLACLNHKSDDSHHWLLVLPSYRSLRMDIK